MSSIQRDLREVRCRNVSVGGAADAGRSGTRGRCEKLEEVGLKFSGMSPDGRLPEIVEWTDHPWFIGVQFHPELKSKPFAPHPLFDDFIRAAKETSRLV